MKARILLSIIVAITIVASIGFGLGPGQKITSVFADMGGMQSGNNMQGMSGMQSTSNSGQYQTPSLYTSTPFVSVPKYTSSSGTCQQVTSPATYAGGPPIPTYTDTTTFSDNPQTFTGWCVVDNSTSSAVNPCYVYQGIAYYGRCETVMPGYNQTGSAPPNIPTEEWFHFGGVHLKPGQFLDVADTTPWLTTMGHMAMVLPCEPDGTPDLRLYQGIIDGGVFTMEAPPVQYLQQLSDPKNGICVYHFNVGADGTGGANPDGITDFALIDVSSHDVYLWENDGRYTSTFSIAKGFCNGCS